MSHDGGPSPSGATLCQSGVIPWGWTPTTCPGRKGHPRRRFIMHPRSAMRPEPRRSRMHGGPAESHNSRRAVAHVAEWIARTGSLGMRVGPWNPCLRRPWPRSSPVRDRRPFRVPAPTEHPTRDSPSSSTFSVGQPWSSPGRMVARGRASNALRPRARRPKEAAPCQPGVNAPGCCVPNAMSPEREMALRQEISPAKAPVFGGCSAWAGPGTSCAPR